MCEHQALELYSIITPSLSSSLINCERALMPGLQIYCPFHISIIYNDVTLPAINNASSLADWHTVKQSVERQWEIVKKANAPKLIVLVWYSCIT